MPYRTLVEHLLISGGSALLIWALNPAWLRAVPLNRTGPTVDELAARGDPLELGVWVLIQTIGVALSLPLYLLFRGPLGWPLWTAAWAAAIGWLPMVRILWILGL